MRVEYRRELAKFMEYADEVNAPLRSAAQVDQAVVGHFNRLYLAGFNAYRGEKMLASLLHHFPEYGRLGPKGLPRGWRSLKGWRRLTPGFSRRPLPLSFWCAFAEKVILHGNLQMGVYTLVSLSAYLRPSEACGLCRRDLVPPAVGGSHCWSILVCPQERATVTKTGERDVSIALDSVWMAQWIAPVMETLKRGPPSEVMWNFGYNDYLEVFRKVRELFGEPSLVPYQLRHSGASIDRSRCWRTLGEVQKRGRWSSAKSVARYGKHGLLNDSLQRHSVAAQTAFVRSEAMLDAIILGHAGRGSRDDGEPPSSRRCY